MGQGLPRGRAPRRDRAAEAAATFPKMLGLAQRQSADLLADDFQRGNGGAGKESSVEFHDDGKRLGDSISVRKVAK
jgi:hypothetical protein